VVKYDKANDIAYYAEGSTDVLEMRDRAENKQQAQAMADSQLHRANSNGVTGSIEIYGNTLAVAGVTIRLKDDFGRFAGRWQVISSDHKLDRSGGYSTDLEIKWLGK